MSSIKLWKSQKRAYKFAKGKSEVALLCEQRTGKTYITLKLIENWKKKLGSEYCGLLVTLLNNKESTWLDKSAEFLPDLQVTSDWEEFKKLKGARLLVVHYEQFVGLINRLVKYTKINWMGIDEGHRIYNRGSKQSRAASRMKWVDNKLLLTGTPIEKQPLDLFAQFRWLCPDVFGTNYSEFEKEWLDFEYQDPTEMGLKPGTAQWQRKILQQRIMKSKADFKWERLDEFINLISPYCFRIESGDVGIVKPNIHKVIVPMSNVQTRMYKEMTRDSMVITEDGTEIIAGLPITKVMKQRQIASGFIYDEDKELHQITRLKQRRIVRLAESLSKPVVIFTAFKPDTETIFHMIQSKNYDVIKVHGATKKQIRPELWRRFQRAEFDIAVVQIKTGGVGVDLWKSNNAIVGSMGHSSVDWDQAKARLNHIHKKIASDIYVVCSEKTIDEDLYDLVVKKGLTSKRVLSKLKGATPWPRTRQKIRRKPKKPKQKRRTSSSR